MLQQQPELFAHSGGQHVSCVNRLDRLVSGLVVLARDPGTADALRRDMQEGRFEKIYLARVRGDFSQIRMKRWVERGGGGEVEEREIARKEGEGAKTEREIARTEGEGARTENTPGAEDTARTAVAPRTDSSLAHSESSLAHSESSLAHSESQPQSPLADPHSQSPLDRVIKDHFSHLSPDPVTWSCSAPLHIVEHKVGISTVACPSHFPSTAKPSRTHFRLLHYDRCRDESLLLVQPVTGRTHQIRIHLQYCGFPICRDPLYGSELWEGMLGEPGTKEWFEAAKGVAQEMRRRADEAEGAEGAEGESARGERSERASDAEPQPTNLECPDCKHPKKDPRPEDLSMDLHAFKYSGPIGSFETALPIWAQITK